MNERQDLLAQILILTAVGVGSAQLFSLVLSVQLLLVGWVFFILPFVLADVAFIILVCRARGWYYWFYNEPSEGIPASGHGSELAG